MAKNKLLFTEGASIHRPPMFCGLNYQFWKVRMRIFIEFVDRSVWDAIVNGLYVLKKLVDNEYVNKPWCDWTGDEIRKA